MAKRATFRAHTDRDESGEEHWAPEEIRLAAIALLNKLPAHNEADALAIVDELRSLITSYVYKRLA